MTNNNDTNLGALLAFEKEERERFEAPLLRAVGGLFVALFSAIDTKRTELQ